MNHPDTKHPDVADLKALLNGELTAQQADLVLEHLENCDRCEATLCELESDTGSREQTSAVEQAPDYSEEDECKRAVVQAVQLKQPFLDTVIGYGNHSASVGGIQTVGLEERHDQHDEAAALPKDFGEYVLLRVIARGGMGVVYEAKHKKLNRLVALKMILSGELATRDDVERFYAEAEAAANLDHPNIVPVYEVGEFEGQHYFAMGLVRGQSLADRIAEGVLPPREAAKLVKVISEAIAFAHSRGTVHRDLKPANVLLAVVEEETIANDGSTLKSFLAGSSQTGIEPIERLTVSPKVADFGLAKRMEGSQGMTVTGQVLGTPAYMPPEQAAGRTSEVTETADVYSLGAILYCALIGRPPFQAASAIETLRQVIDQEASPPRKINTAIAIDLETICMKCLQKDPLQRYASAADLAVDLGCFLEGRPIAARPVGWVGQTTRWCRRNPLVTSLVAGVLFSLLTGIVASSYFAVRANSEAITAKQNFQTANRERAAADRARERSVDAEEQMRIAKIEADDAREKAEAAKVVAEEGKKQEQAARKRAEIAEQETQNALAKSRLALAEVYYQQDNTSAMKAELEQVPTRLRDANWQYLENRADTSITTVQSPNAGSLRFSAAIPRSGGKFFVSGSNGAFIVNGWTGEIEETIAERSESMTLGLYPNAVSPDGRVLAAINRSQSSAEVYDLSTLELLVRFKLDDRPTLFFDAKRSLYAARSDRTEQYDYRTGELQATCPGLRLLAVAPKTNLLIGSLDNRLVALNSLEGPIVWSADDVETSLKVRAACSPDGKYVTVLHEAERTRTFPADEEGSAERHPLYSCDAPAGQFARVFYSAQGRSFITLGMVQDSTPIRIWDSRSGLRVHSLLGSPATAQEPSYDPETGLFLVPYGHGVKVWHLKTDADSQVFPGGPQSFAFGGENTIWRSIADDVGIAKVNRDESTAGIYEPSERCARVAVSRNGKVAVLARARGSLMLVRKEADSYVEKEMAHFRFDKSLAVSPTGKFCVALDYKGRVSVFHGVTGKKGFEVRVGAAGKMNAGNFVDFLSDDRVIACRPLGNLPLSELVAFSVTKRTEVRKRVDFSVHSMAASHDGSRFVLGCGDSHARIYNAATFELALPPIRVHDQEVTAICFHPELPVLVTGSADRSIRLWNFQDGTQIGEFVGLRGTPTKLDFDATGGSLGALCKDLHLWNVQAELAKVRKPAARN